jgi:hypothetical protein
MEIANELARTIIKWAVVVFIAGFIGQFGKSLTKHIIAKIRGKKTPSAAPSKKISKLEKKRRKAELKRMKKR